MTPHELLKKLQADFNTDVKQYEYTSPPGVIYFSLIKKQWAAILECKDGIRHIGFFPTRREAREAHKEAVEQFRGY